LFTIPGEALVCFYLASKYAEVFLNLMQILARDRFMVWLTLVMLWAKLYRVAQSASLRMLR